jgi:transcriptional regulator with XRE-family HTH domain
MSAFSKNLRKIRREKDLTQKQIAEKIGIAEALYQVYEHGKSSPGLEKLILLADCLNVSIDWLTGRTDNPNSHK